MRRFWQAVQAERQMIFIAALIFLVSAIYSYFNADTLIKTLVSSPAYQQILEIVKNTKQNPQFSQVFITLFLNNIQASFIMLASGLLFGFLPFIGVITNGVLLGITLNQAALKTGQDPLTIFVKYILPHGILELPAFILAVAMGLRLRLSVFRTFTSFLRNQREKSIMEWKALLKRLPAYCIGIIVLLLFAAIIESALIVSSIT
jgi:stage II sporulation protein M